MKKLRVRSKGLEFLVLHIIMRLVVHFTVCSYYVQALLGTGDFVDFREYE
jgi:hypothetical protein